MCVILGCRLGLVLFEAAKHSFFFYLHINDQCQLEVVVFFNEREQQPQLHGMQMVQVNIPFPKR